METACLEDFGLQFLDCILSLIESKTHENTRMADHRTAATLGSLEDVYLEKLLWAVCHRLAIQCSTKIVKSLAKKVVSFAFSSTLETDVSGKLFAAICQAFVTVSDTVFMFCIKVNSLHLHDLIHSCDIYSLGKTRCYASKSSSHALLVNSALGNGRYVG